MNYIERINKLQHKMKEKSLHGFLIAQNVDLYYFTGTLQTGYLFIPNEGEATLYIKKSVLRAQEESAVTVKPLGSFRSFGALLLQDYPQILAVDSRPAVALEFDVLPVEQYRRLHSILPGIQWEDGSLLIREIRMIKSAAEIDRIKQSARVIDIALETAVAKLKVGMMEFELMSIVEQSIRLNGHIGIMRMRGFNQELITGMIGSGSAAALPTYFDGPAGGEGLSPASPQSAGRKTIQRDEPILIDIGCCIDGYVIDQTRTVVIGDLEPELAVAYACSEQILRDAEAHLKPGAACEQLYANSTAIAKAAGLSDHFMGYGDDKVKFLGHGIGLEIDELPILARGFKYLLEPGMVIAVEPKFTFPKRGVVGIENTYAITNEGFEKLTVSREGIIHKLLE